MFLRILVVRNLSLAEQILQKLNRGASFADLARQHSIDRTAADGGYLGSISLTRMNREFQQAATGLGPGAYSSIFRSGFDYALLYRMPADFQERARRLEEEGDRLRQEGEWKRAIEVYREALERTRLCRSLGQTRLLLRPDRKVVRGPDGLLPSLSSRPRFRPGPLRLGEVSGLAGTIAGSRRALEKRGGSGPRPDPVRRGRDLGGTGGTGTETDSPRSQAAHPQVQAVLRAGRSGTVFGRAGKGGPE